MKKKAVYVEPDDYFPKELRKKYGLGEYNTDVDDEKKEDKRKDLKKRKDLPDEVVKRKAAKK